MLFASRINVEAPGVFKRMIELTLDNKADYLNVLLTVLEALVELKRAGANGKVIVHSGIETRGNRRGKRYQSVELRTTLGTFLNLVDIQSKP